MPVYEDFSIDAGGNNGTYQLIELVAVKLLQQVNLTGGPPDYVTPCMSQTSNKRRICVEVVSAGSSSFEIDTDPDVVPNNSLFKIRLAQ